MPFRERFHFWLLFFSACSIIFVLSFSAKIRKKTGSIVASLAKTSFLRGNHGPGFYWEEVSFDRLRDLLSKEEFESIPLNSSNNGICRKRSIEKVCCLGSISQGGETRHLSGLCYANILPERGIFKQRYPVKYNRIFQVQDQEVLYDMLDVLDVLSDAATPQRNKTMVFVGDSIMQQVFEGLLCEVGRLTGKSLRIVSHRRKLVDWIVGSSTRNVVSFPERHVNLVQYREFRPHPNGLTIKEACKEADVLVFNYGAHWNDVYEYEQDMSRLAKVVKAHCVGVALVFRGSTSQHFLTRNGRFSREKSRISKEINSTIGPDIREAFDRKNNVFQTGCRPIREQASGTRDRAAVAAFRSQDFKVVDLARAYGGTPSHYASSNQWVLNFIPLEKITNELYDMHDTECTHYCTSPLLWAPISHYIFKAIGRPMPKLARIPMSPPPWARFFSRDPDFQIDEFLNESNGIYVLR